MSVFARQVRPCPVRECSSDNQTRTEPQPTNQRPRDSTHQDHRWPLEAERDNAEVTHRRWRNPQSKRQSFSFRKTEVKPCHPRTRSLKTLTFILETDHGGREPIIGIETSPDGKWTKWALTTFYWFASISVTTNKLGWSVATTQDPWVASIAVAHNLWSRKLENESDWEWDFKEASDCVSESTKGCSQSVQTSYKTWMCTLSLAMLPWRFQKPCWRMSRLGVAIFTAAGIA